MGIRQFKPVTKGTRFRSVPDFSEITRSTPEKSLTVSLKKSGGRDNHGHIAMRRIGGGHKRMYRIIDFKRNKFGMQATVREIEKPISRASSPPRRCDRVRTRRMNSMKVAIERAAASPLTPHSSGGRMKTRQRTKFTIIAMIENVTGVRVSLSA